ncbi:MAG: hypothetical protein COC19_03685 [SAR86 cluster bacterium]|uniref:DUF4440 domain-containing protein n=1 Tax=SAR86 cluster bacterium TaxID=2030880 RepID=A0A2A4MQD7_9GAMM|nr:MAG: hypothetical protein COC19_03685 [SAR86 cluster bacterium]
MIYRFRKSLNQITLTPLILLLVSCFSMAAENSPEQSARAALDAFLEDWNRSDLQAIQEHLSFPHITHGPGQLIIAEEEGLFVQDFEALRAQGWRRSTFDSFQVLQASENKVNFLVDFKRYGSNDEILSQAQVFYVVTKQDDGWGMQYRSGGPHADDIAEGIRDRAIQEATSAIYAFFDAFNEADNTALFEVNHVPQVMLNTGLFLHAVNRESLPVTVNFDGLRARESWGFSIAEDLEIIHAMPGNVIFQLEFERFNSAGSKYRRVPALWVLTQINGKWGVQFRSLMPPV